jgi:hypothetical protein
MLTGLRVGAYALRAELAGHGIWNAGPFNPIHIAQDARSRNLKITLYPATYLSGVVTDQSGRPLEGAELEERDTGFSAVSDGAGRFQLGPFTAQSEVWVRARFGGYSTRELNLKAPQSDLSV